MILFLFYAQSSSRGNKPKGKKMHTFWQLLGNLSKSYPSKEIILAFIEGKMVVNHRRDFGFTSFWYNGSFCLWIWPDLWQSCPQAIQKWMIPIVILLSKRLHIIWLLDICETRATFIMTRKWITNWQWQFVSVANCDSFEFVKFHKNLKIFANQNPFFGPWSYTKWFDLKTEFRKSFDFHSVNYFMLGK